MTLLEPGRLGAGPSNRRGTGLIELDPLASLEMVLEMSNVRGPSLSPQLEISPSE